MVKKVYWKKLVRDKIPEIIKKDGRKLRLRILKLDQLKKHLVKKLIEEAEELSFKY